jgi:V/A-type H+-transporting ATPase subunit D
MSVGGGTRVELIRLKRAALLVSQGIRILSAKRDALTLEFGGLVTKARATGLKLAEDMGSAEKSLLVASALEPKSGVATAALSAARNVRFRTSVKNVWGVRIPSAIFPDTRRAPFDRGSAPGYRQPSVDETSGYFEKAIRSLLENAIDENRLSTIGGALKSATRRVNALEMRVAPEIKAETAQIQLRLEEIEREEKFRQKRYKSINQGTGI